MRGVCEGGGMLWDWVIKVQNRECVYKLEMSYQRSERDELICSTCVEFNTKRDSRRILL